MLQISAISHVAPFINVNMEVLDSQHCQTRAVLIYSFYCTFIASMCVYHMGNNKLT